MAEIRRYKVVDGPISIRKEPDGQRLAAQLLHGEEIEIVSDPVEAGGFVWVQHKRGWSASGTREGDEIFMLDISNRPPDAPRIFRVWAQSLSIRDAPNGKRLTKKLPRKTEITVDPQSRTEAGGYIWWKHDSGWSAECSANGRELFMKEVFDEPPTARLDPAKRVELPAHYKGKMTLQIAQQTKVRDKPSTDPRGMIIILLKRGKTVEVDMNTLTEADGYYWVRHDLGWSAVQSIDGTDVFMAEPGTIAGLPYIGPDGPKAEDLPSYKALFSRYPVDLSDVQWFQYFGNNMWAYTKGKSYGYDRYSQGLHGGLDFGNSAQPGVRIYAGMVGEYIKTEYTRRNNTRIFLKNGPYTVIYQHITNCRAFTPGQAIMPDTVLAEIEHHTIDNGWDHLHLEVRFMEDWIINPLLLLPETMYNQLTARFKPDKPNTDYKNTESAYNFFYKTDAWTKWTTPLDQPMIRLAGDPIGPRFVKVTTE